MERVTCYKLCYALGVSEKNLQSEFLIEHRIANLGDVFCPGEGLKRYRALSAVYFLIMNNYREYVDTPTFEKKIGSTYRAFVKELGYNPAPSRGRRSLLSYLQEVVTEHNSLCDTAYDQLQIALPYELFCTLTLLPELTPSRVAQISFLMSNTGHFSGLYFYGHELLNVALGSMLQDDMCLRDRLSLFLGESLGSLHDRSEMALVVERYLRGVFLKADQLCKRKNLVYYEGSKRTEELANYLSTLPPIPLVTSLEELKAGTTCVTADSKWVASVVKEYPGVDFAVLLPVENKYYKLWRSRRVPNIYLVSQR